jgi:two-component sensor histidine kinase
MPLTEQEKLLLRIAHHRAPGELVALSPLLRAARDEEEKAEVQQFFEPRTTEDNE